MPELERSGDLAEHIAQRAVTNVGSKMSPLSRGIIQRMAEVALEMWHDAADAYGDRAAQAAALAEADEEIDILHERLTKEIAGESMPTADRRPGDAPGPLLRALGGPRREPGPSHRDAAPPRLAVSRRHTGCQRSGAIAAR